MFLKQSSSVDLKLGVESIRITERVHRAMLIMAFMSLILLLTVLQANQDCISTTKFSNSMDMTSLW